MGYFKGTIKPRTEILDSLLGHQPLAIGDLILTEVLQGFANDRDFIVATNLLTSLVAVDLGGQEIAIQSGEEFPDAAQTRRDRSKNHRYSDCHPMHRERIRLATQRQGL